MGHSAMSRFGIVFNDQGIKVMKRLVLLMVLSGLPFALQAGPQINVGTVYDYLDGDKSTYLKRVFNSGDSTAFVKVNILEILYDADGTSREIEVRSQADMSSRDGLMASPARLIVPANGMQGTRLLMMGERDQERYFRVRFIPVVPEKEDEFAVSAEEREQYKNTLSAGVNVMTGFGTVFFVRPKNSRFDSVIEDAPTTYRVRNNGNTTIRLDKLTQCSANRQDCDKPVLVHLLPGKTTVLQRKPNHQYLFELQEGDQKKMMEL